jgi:molybdopterin-guanine dinucleotide biosynthesis protein A
MIFLSESGWRLSSSCAGDSPYNSRMNHGAIILCGGMSSRMGRPKALLPWRGTTMIAHVVGILKRAVSEVIVVASEELHLPPLDATVVRDREPKLGPLAGLREGLEALSADLAFATSTDAPFISEPFVTKMLSFGRAAAPDVGGFVQTLSAVFPKSLAPKAAELIAQQRMSVLGLLTASDFHRVHADELPDLDSIRGFNTPDEYLTAVRNEPSADPVRVEFLGLSRTITSTPTFDAPPAKLGEILDAASSRLNAAPLVSGGAVAPHILISLNGELFVRDLNVPVGAGERLLIIDAAAGG